MVSVIVTLKSKKRRVSALSTNLLYFGICLAA
jgi:hypothetical protein